MGLLFDSQYDIFNFNASICPQTICFMFSLLRKKRLKGWMGRYKCISIVGMPSLINEAKNFKIRHSCSRNMASPSVSLPPPPLKKNSLFIILLFFSCKSFFECPLAPTPLSQNDATARPVCRVHIGKPVYRKSMNGDVRHWTHTNQFLLQHHKI